MNQAVTAPRNFQPAACPLLTAVLPLRYAIGPRNSVDAASYGLPTLSGNFPSLTDPLAPQDFHPLGYTSRLLRDGWLYLWHPTHKRMAEYQVEQSLLCETERGGPVVDKRTKPYLILEAGTPATLAWSPCRWSHEQFEAAKARDDIRQRVMRRFTPGAAPFGGQARKIHEQIGDYMFPGGFKWSCAPDTRHRPDWSKTIDAMEYCEQQSYVIIDDAWGVLMDLAGLLRARRQAFDSLSRDRADEWATAALVQSIGDSDEEVRRQFASLINLPRLQRPLQEQKREQDALESDLLRLASAWAAWFDTLGGNTPASLESACEHFDITQPDARDMLEASFVAACLGPAATSPGIKAIEAVLDPARLTGEPWLLWALLGVGQRLEPGHLKQLLHVPENLAPVADELGKGAANLARATALVAALNLGADKLSSLLPTGGGEPLFAVLSPILGGRLRSLADQIHPLAYTLMTAMLARSQQRLEAARLAPKDALLWLSEQMGQAHNKGQRRSIVERREKMAHQQARASRTGTPATPGKSPLASQVEEAIPHLRVVPKPQPSLPHPLPGYGREAPRVPSPPGKPAPVLPPLHDPGAGLRLPSIGELLNEAPLKTLIAMVAMWNMVAAGRVFKKEKTVKNFVAAGSAAMATATAATAVLQQLADIRWEQHVAQASHVDDKAREYLARALGLGSFALLFQAITAGVDVLYFGWQAVDAYRVGDLDTAAVNAGLAGANLAYAEVSRQAMRTLRVARAAVLAGEAKALASGIRVLSLPLRLSLLGLTVTILVGLASLFYTQDTPLQQWLKQTRFGPRPADWSGDLPGTLRAFYRIVLPVSLRLERWNDINPRTGQWVNELRLVLRLPGQREYLQGMVSFDGHEEWTRQTGLFGSAGRCTPLVWGEDDPIPFDLDTGSRVAPEPDGSVRLRRVYHDDGLDTLVAVRGSLTYQPIDGLFLPPIDIDLS